MNKVFVERKNVFRGYMTTPIKFVYETDRDKIRFRSTYGEFGTVSRLNIKGRKYGVYATIDTADAYKKLSDDNPRESVEKLLELAKETGKSELIEVAEYFLDKECRACIPIIELDKDVI